MRTPPPMAGHLSLQLQPSSGVERIRMQRTWRGLAQRFVYLHKLAARWAALFVPQVRTQPLRDGKAFKKPYRKSQRLKQADAERCGCAHASVCVCGGFGGGGGGMSVTPCAYRPLQSNRHPCKIFEEKDLEVKQVLSIDSTADEMYWLGRRGLACSICALHGMIHRICFRLSLCFRT